MITDDIVTARILFIVLPFVMGAVHCIWRKNAIGFSKTSCFLAYFLMIGVGLQSLLVGHLEIYRPEVVAAYLGWENSPFLLELGKANIAFGVMGILSFWFGNGWRESTAVGYGLFMLMLGIGHYHYYIDEAHAHNPIIGVLVATDLIMAACLFTLLFLRRRHHTA